VERVGVVAEVARRRAHERVARADQRRHQVVRGEVDAWVHREDRDVGILRRRAVQDALERPPVGGVVVDDLGADGGVELLELVREARHQSRGPVIVDSSAGEMPTACTVAASISSAPRARVNQLTSSCSSSGPLK